MTGQQKLINKPKPFRQPQKHLPMQLIMLFNAILLVIVIIIGGIVSYFDIQFSRKLGNENVLQAEATENLVSRLVVEQLPLKSSLNRFKITIVGLKNELELFIVGNDGEQKKLNRHVQDLLSDLKTLETNWRPYLDDTHLTELKDLIEWSSQSIRLIEEKRGKNFAEFTYIVAEAIATAESINDKTAELERYLDSVNELTAQEILAGNQQTTNNSGILADLIQAFERRYFITLGVIISIVTIFQISLFLILKERLGSLTQIAAKISNSGNLSERVNWISKDEIGTLVKTFNQMLDRLELAHNEITANEAYLDDIFHSMLNALFVLKPDKTIRTVNHSLLNLLGYQEEELLNQPIDLFFPGHPSHLCPTDWNIPMTQRHIVDGEEHKFLTKAGLEVSVLLSCSIVREISEDNKGIVCVAQDISQLKQMEGDRKKLEDQLRQSQKMEAIGTLAGGIAHDFNNILSTMQGFTWLLLADKQEPSEEKDYLTEIYNAGERAAGLIQQILTFSRTDNQEKKPLKLSPLVKEALRFIRATIPKSIEIRQEIFPETQTVMANATQIHQIIINLCTNSLHAMKNQNGTLTVTLDEADASLDHDLTYEFPEQDFVRISISDTGRGISPEIKNRIFEPFFTTKEVGEGTGLGLSVVHGIVKSHEGRIFVDSKENQGTTFTIYLPAVEEADEEDQAKVFVKPVKGKEHILIVEDEPSLSRFYEISLSQLGYRVSREKNGDDALEFFKHTTDKVDLVFTDQAMPTITGIQLSQELLKIDPKLPIVMATGYKSEELRHQAETVGIRHFLEKPVNIGLLTQSIRQIFDSDAIENQFAEESANQNIEEELYINNTQDIIHKRDEYREIVPLFLEERQKEVYSILEAINKANYEEIYSLGHKMQGASDAFGFTSVSRIGLALKQSALKGENNLIQDKVEELKTYLIQLETEYKV